jgi:hypothetical protein
MYKRSCTSRVTAKVNVEPTVTLCVAIHAAAAKVGRDARGKIDKQD